MIESCVPFTIRVDGPQRCADHLAGDLRYFGITVILSLVS
jgi:hypothetical protein